MSRRPNSGIIARVLGLDRSASLSSFRDHVFGIRHVVTTRQPPGRFEGCSPQSAWLRAALEIAKHSSSQIAARSS